MFPVVSMPCHAQMLVLYSPYGEMKMSVASMWPKFVPFVDNWFMEVSRSVIAKCSIIPAGLGACVLMARLVWSAPRERP